MVIRCSGAALARLSRMPVLTRSMDSSRRPRWSSAPSSASSIFVQPSEVSRDGADASAACCSCGRPPARSPGSARAICAELASANPRTGGVYVYLREMFSPAAGFLWGWAMFWSMHSRHHRGDRDGVRPLCRDDRAAGDAGIRLIAVGAIVVLSAINYFGVRPGSSGADRIDDGENRGRDWYCWSCCSRTARARCRHAAGCDRRLADFFARSWPDCSPSAAGTWSPTPQKKPAILNGRSRER